MGSFSFLSIFAQFLNVFAWPSFPLVYPLYASIRAVESDTESCYEQCLKYWVLFSTVLIMECALAKVLLGISLWPYVRGIAAVLLALPSFAGASCVYLHLVRSHIDGNSFLRGMLHIQESESCLVRQKKDFSRTIHARENEGELVNLVTCQAVTEATYNTVRRVVPELGSLNNVQNQWSCPICLISTSSQKCLRAHLQGKKHKVKEAQHRLKLGTVTTETNISVTMKRATSVVGKFNQFKMVDVQKMRYFICRVTRPRWLSWVKPGFGWTKLNTDGSIDQESAGFGGLLRDFRGDPVCAYVSKAPGDDIFLAELWAIWRGLILASSLGIKFIWVESDSMSVVKTINKEQKYGPKGSSCLKQIWKLLQKFEKFLISHSWRETNRAADYLSKMDLAANDTVLWPDDFPIGLSMIIKEDALGTKYYRG